MMPLRHLLRRVPAPSLALPGWLERLLMVGIVTNDPRLARRQRCVNVACHAAVASCASHLVITSLYDFRGLLLLNAYNVMMIAIGVILPRWHRLGANVVAIALILLAGLGQMYVIWMLGINSALHIVYTLAGATLFFFGIENWKLSLAALVYIAALLWLALNFAPIDGLLLPGDGRLRELISRHTMMSVAAINAALIFYALTLVRRAEVELEQQHEHSETLIATVMPAAIAARLTASESRVADHVENLTVLFADLAGFTAAAQDLPPEEIVGFLDGVVRAFDALTEPYGVEKIKTVGDCYMAAAGFDGRAAEGAVAIGHFARAMIAINSTQPKLGGRKLDLRVGIHCGPATAGVIGDARFSYDIWGATVSAASCMQSQGEPGRIQVSEAFRALAKGHFEFVEHGVTEIRGIVLTRTYFLVGL